MLSYDEFKQEITEHIKEHLPEQYSGARVELHKIVKNNGLELDAINIIPQPAPTVVPNIYLNSAYEEYRDGADLYEIMDGFADSYCRSTDMQELAETFSTDYEHVKDWILPKFINREMNRELLSACPHTDMADLSVIYRITCPLSDGSQAAVTITNDMVSGYGVTAGQLHETAVANMERTNAPRFMSLNEAITEAVARDMFDGDIDAARNFTSAWELPETPGVYVLTNANGIEGAAAILSEKTMDGIKDKLGENISVLPSSVHEVLILRDSGGHGFEPDFLVSMVTSVNNDENVIKPTDVLSNNAYRYDFSRHRLVSMQEVREKSLAGNVTPSKPEHKPEPVKKKAKHR